MCDDHDWPLPLLLLLLLLLLPPVATWSFRRVPQMHRYRLVTTGRHSEHRFTMDWERATGMEASTEQTEQPISPGRSPEYKKREREAF